MTLIFSSSLLTGEQPATEPLVVFAVRHAEKLDASRDPALSPQGAARAGQLADVLRDAQVRHIHSSDYQRTRDTAAPLAAQRELDVRLYNPRDLPALVVELRRVGGRHLVVGHSNTTPKLVELLGGEAGAVIDEESEFDRLYVVTVDAKSKATTLLMRYGKSSRPRAED